MALRRVYHPSLNAWQDVDSSTAQTWKAAGWRLTKPSHVDDSEALPVEAAGEPAPAKVEKSA